MSNISGIYKRSSRSDAIVSTAVDPVTKFISEDHFEAIANAITDTEKVGGIGGELSCLVSMVKDLWANLKKEGIKHRFSKKDLIIWTILEIIDTEVSFDEVYEWVAHEPTLCEIIISQDPSSLSSLLKNEDAEMAWSRYQKLLRDHL